MNSGPPEQSLVCGVFLKAEQPIPRRNTYEVDVSAVHSGRLACVDGLALVTPSMAAMVKLKADLKASEEVPPNDSKATGAVITTYDTAPRC